MSVIAVDWKGGSGLPYYQAAANTRLVGAEISNMIKHLHAQYVISPKKVHIIGYSLGAHIAGYVGRNLDKIGRITGLDPDEPGYKDTDPLVHLDKTDAEFVDIIHTNGSGDSSGFGWMKDTGHIDFYPNGGENQPGCSENFMLLLTGYNNQVEIAFGKMDSTKGKTKIEVIGQDSKSDSVVIESIHFCGYNQTLVDDGRQLTLFKMNTDC
ncbi:pancreatic triacylglycerol lipase-like [Mercenaria mercenaria]|uniref:pancreatic triacylglycerol lipase-like n=1 Tax=Mercenaria mercenaria TaxID=6596 RepID=UPI00234F4E14|nr:pancreatic triacylglycerol lipase-like [Mercenaria mercenaria]